MRHIIELFGPIGEGFDLWSGVEMRGETWLAEELRGHGDVDILVNSDGGAAFSGQAMRSLIARHEGIVIVEVLSLAASAASLLIMAADKIVMSVGAQLMIHEPYSMAMGTADELRKQADVLAGIRDSTLIPAYAERTGLTTERVAEMVAAETWLDADEAVDMGFADSISGQEAEMSYLRPGVAARAPAGMVCQNSQAFRRNVEDRRNKTARALASRRASLAAERNAAAVTARCEAR